LTPGCDCVHYLTLDAAKLARLLATRNRPEIRVLDAAALRETRIHCGWSEVSIAGALGVSAAAIFRIEHDADQRCLYLAFAVELARCVGLPLSELLVDEHRWPSVEYPDPAVIGGDEAAETLARRNVTQMGLNSNEARLLWRLAKDSPLHRPGDLNHWTLTRLAAAGLIDISAVPTGGPAPPWPDFRWSPAHQRGAFQSGGGVATGSLGA
jgi:DNA-binding XRE family transcriptional regulator